MAEINLLSPTEVRALLTRYGIRPKKRLGQNFLIDRNVLDKIIRAANIDRESYVVEIGPGLGTLTRELSKAAAKVVAIEADADMVGILSETAGDLPNVEVVHADFLSLKLSEFLPERFGDSRCTVVANLPYYITSPLTIRLIEAKQWVDRMIIMVQAEVAARLMAAPGTGDYGSLTVFAGYHSSISLVAKVKHTVFYPAPEVDSAVVRIDIREKPAVQVSDENLFFLIVRASFGQRRKTLLKALSGSTELGWSRGRSEAVLTKAGIDPVRRGETLSLEEFASLTEAAAQLRLVD